MTSTKVIFNWSWMVALMDISVYKQQWSCSHITKKSLSWQLHFYCSLRKEKKKSKAAIISTKVCDQFSVSFKIIAIFSIVNSISLSHTNWEGKSKKAVTYHCFFKKDCFQFMVKNVLKYVWPFYNFIHERVK